jgi:hypothetical protein
MLPLGYAPNPDLHAGPLNPDQLTVLLLLLLLLLWGRSLPAPAD